MVAGGRARVCGRCPVVGIGLGDSGRVLVPSSEAEVLGRCLCVWYYGFFCCLLVSFLFVCFLMAKE